MGVKMEVKMVQGKNMSSNIKNSLKHGKREKTVTEQQLEINIVWLFRRWHN
jgi:hypothetical protein